MCLVDTKHMYTKTVYYYYCIPALNHEAVDCPGCPWGRSLAVTLGYFAHNLKFTQGI